MKNVKRFNRYEWKKINRLSKKYKAIQYLGGKCELCGENNLFCLEFHHNEDEIKETTFWSIGEYRWSVIEKELKKCKLLCGNCHGKLHYNNTNESTSYKTNKKIFLEYKGINGCEKCGYNECNSSLDFHHINENEKEFTFGEITSKYNNIQDLTEKIENEINKCEVLCKNCHKLVHSDINFFENNKDKIIIKANNLRETQSKIDRNQVRELYEKGMKQIEIAKYFNASKSTICDIIKNLKKSP